MFVKSEKCKALNSFSTKNKELLKHKKWQKDELPIAFIENHMGMSNNRVGKKKRNENSQGKKTAYSLLYAYFILYFTIYL